MRHLRVIAFGFLFAGYGVSCGRQLGMVRAPEARTAPPEPRHEPVSERKPQHLI